MNSYNYISEDGGLTAKAYSDNRPNAIVPIKYDLNHDANYEIRDKVNYSSLHTPTDRYPAQTTTTANALGYGFDKLRALPDLEVNNPLVPISTPSNASINNPSMAYLSDRAGLKNLIADIINKDPSCHKQIASGIIGNELHHAKEVDSAEVSTKEYKNKQKIKQRIQLMTPEISINEKKDVILGWGDNERILMKDFSAILLVSYYPSVHRCLEVHANGISTKIPTDRLKSTTLTKILLESGITLDIPPALRKPVEDKLFSFIQNIMKEKELNQYKGMYKKHNDQWVRAFLHSIDDPLSSIDFESTNKLEIASTTTGTVDKTYRMIALLKSLGANYPILSELGFNPGAILVVVDSGQLVSLREALAITHEVALAIDTHRNKIKKALLSHVSEVIMFSFRPTIEAYYKKQLDYIEDIIKTGMVDGTPIYSLPLFICEETPELSINPPHNVLFYRIAGSIRGTNPSVYDITCDDEDQTLVAHRIQNIISSIDLNNSEKTLAATACYICKGSDDLFTKEFDEYRDLIYSISEYDANMYRSQKQSLGDVFKTVMHDYIINHPVCAYHIYDKTIPPIHTVKDSCILFDDNYLYLTKDLFKKILAPITEVYATGKIYSSLIEEHILIPYGGKNDYQTRVNLKTGERPRMYCIDRDATSMEGSLDILDYIVCNPEEGGDV